eukprot:5146807-Pyramimonas_sp.AAC.1
MRTARGPRGSRGPGTRTRIQSTSPGTQRARETKIRSRVVLGPETSDERGEICEPRGQSASFRRSQGLRSGSQAK